jgi:hypothetical protein
MAVEDSEVIKAKSVLQLPAYESLTERLGEYFPNTDMGWLTDEYDKNFAKYFTSDEGGWLTGEQDAEFWNLMRGSSKEEPSDAVSNWLSMLLDQWGRKEPSQAEDGESEEADAGDEVDAGSRFAEDQITLVGPDYPDLWQGYDQVDEVWKYITSSSKPTGESSGWMLSEEAFAEADDSAKPEGTESAFEMDPALVEFVSQMVAAAQQEKLPEFFGISEEELPEDSISQ